MMSIVIAMTTVSAWSGTWVLDETLMVQIRPPVPVGWVNGRTVSRWLVDWSPGDDAFTATLCHLHVDPVLGAQTTWPDAARDAVPALTRPVSFDGTRFRAGPVVETIGGSDEDGDGHPGITFAVTHPRAGSGEVYIKQTATLAWDGQLLPDGAIVGTVRYEPEQEMLGASTWWLRMGLAQRAHRTEVSTFSLTPVPVGAGCTDIPPP